ncbi:dual specificity protein phosphatase family protein [Ectothiorhodospiraceae bacterium WFHF3C12]|nr:dual specificity protein phosphatase family protein [Ectothiorhodospiraceae bacterium WFHF3C12]
MNILPIRDVSGEIALIPCPGRAGRGGTPRADLEPLHSWGAAWLVTLMESHELAFFGLEDLGLHARSAGLAWLHAPIADFAAPGAEFERVWARRGNEVQDHLRDGGRVAIHCLAGLGRTGTVAARILIELGYAPDEAVASVRAVRPGAIQSHDQLDYVMNRRWRHPNRTEGGIEDG